MTIPSGLAAQIGYKAESTYGTAVTVDRFLPLVSQNFKIDIERLESAGILASRRTMASKQWRPGGTKISGSVQHEVTDNSIGLLLEHAFGTVNTTGSGPYTHTFTPGALTDTGFTTQVGIPRSDGSAVDPVTFAGCKIAGMSIAGSVGQIGTLGVDIVAQSYDTVTSLASASYGSSDTLMTFVQGLVTIAGSAPAAVVTDFELNIDNGLKTDRHDIGQTNVEEPLEETHRTYSGSITLEFDDSGAMSEVNRYLNGTEAAVVLGFDDGDNELKFTLNCRFDGNLPTVGGPQVVTYGLDFKGVSDTSDAAVCTAVLINDDSTP